jgi:hypothetical protein
MPLVFLARHENRPYHIFAIVERRSDNVGWQPYEQGVAMAKQENKPRVSSSPTHCSKTYQNANVSLWMDGSVMYGTFCSRSASKPCV